MFIFVTKCTQNKFINKTKTPVFYIKNVWSEKGFWEHFAGIQIIFGTVWNTHSWDQTQASQKIALGELFSPLYCTYFSLKLLEIN